MLEKIVAQIALVLLGWVEKRIQSSKTAVDADEDVERLRRAGSRIDEWLREQNRIHTGVKSDALGSTGESKSIHTPTGGVGVEQQPGGLT